MNITTDTAPCGQTLTHLSIAQGELVALDIGFAADDGALDLTAASLALTVAFPTPLALTTANGGITLAAPGHCRINIPTVIARTLPLGTYRYDAWLNGNLQFLSGQFTVRASVTPL